MKRLMDLLLAGAALLLLSPVLLAVALTALSSSGPVIYSQTRTGRGRRTFTIYKVRTMYHDCERLSGPRWSSADDPRVTPVGRLIRRAHLDELPQIWNVLRGDMSLVGPRPERPEFVAQLDKALPRYGERLSVAPGLTGLAQINLPPDTDHESVRRKLTLDLTYLEQRCAWLDLRIMAGTALYLAGVPSPSTSRLLALPSGPSPRPAVRPPGPVEVVAQAVPAWREM